MIGRPNILAMEKKTILCVDDEKVVLSSLKSQLKCAFGEDFTIEAAEGPEEGLDIIEDCSNQGGVHIIVTDWLMPDMKGDEFLIRVHEKHPDIVKIILTGHADQSAILNASDNANLYKCLPKPWKREDLVTAVRKGLACA